MFGWRWVQIDPDAPQIEAMWCMWTSKSCSTWRNLGPGDSSGDKWVIITKTWVIITKKGDKLKTRVSTVSYCAGHVSGVELTWSSTWAEVVPKWAQLEAKLRHLGPKLGWGWSQVVPGWAEVGALLAKVDPKLHLCCRQVGTNIWLDVGQRWADIQNAQVVWAVCTYWRPARFENASLSQLNRLFIRITHCYTITPRHLFCVKILETAFGFSHAFPGSPTYPPRKAEEIAANLTTACNRLVASMSHGRMKGIRKIGVRWVSKMNFPLRFWIV